MCGSKLNIVHDYGYELVETINDNLSTTKPRRINYNEQDNYKVLCLQCGEEVPHEQTSELSEKLDRCLEEVG